MRLFIGNIIILFDRLFPPRVQKRSAAEQERLNRRAASLTLFQFRACPFCLKVRRSAKRLSIPLTTLDAMKNEAAKQELLKGGGQLQVPCLRIQEPSGNTRWLYESTDIIKYLETI